jgi:hypothetical protein
MILLNTNNSERVRLVEGAVLKTVGCDSFGGSIPSLSAMQTYNNRSKIMSSTDLKGSPLVKTKDGWAVQTMIDGVMPIKEGDGGRSSEE